MAIIFNPKDPKHREAVESASVRRPDDSDRCAECLYSRWYHRIAEALGETDHRFKEDPWKS